MKETILVIDDDRHVGELARLYLQKEGYLVALAHDGIEGLEKARNARPAVIILDIMLPKKDGWEVCRELRTITRAPIIMLTAKGEEADKLYGFDLGADDYMTKPFSPRELVARVRAILRRASSRDSEEQQGVLRFPHLVINVPRFEVEVEGEKVALTPKEFELLKFLAEHPGYLFTREQLLERVWGYDFYGDMRTVDVHIKRVRQKIEREGLPVRFIKTVWGAGYKFEVMPDTPEE
ncbi:MAG: response regulator transcription factor [Firmicutes bacterium]|nr:response regulator transcription factor [Bacillota bacterium]MCL5038649.1 response regulator transcription factor [Bacillota bacterium]